MNRKVSIMDYKSKSVWPIADNYALGNIRYKREMIQNMWDKITYVQPEVKKLFGKEFKLGLKYHINKMHDLYEEQVAIFENRQLPYGEKPFYGKRFIRFYDDLKLLNAIYHYDMDWCENRMMDADPPNEPMQTGFNQSIYYELENRISELKMWKALSEDTTK